MKQTFGTSPEYDEAVRQRIWKLWRNSASWYSQDILYAIYKAGQKGYKLEDLTMDNLRKIKEGK